MYVINPVDLKVYECEIIDSKPCDWFTVYHVEIFDFDMNDTVDFEICNVYETIEEAQQALNEEINDRIESQCSCNYQAGYDFACGIYD